MTSQNETARDGAAAEQGQRTDGQKGGCGCDGTMMAQVSFSTFILSLASSTLVQLGEVPNPDTGKMEEDLSVARHSIDVLCMLQAKTRECLDPDESRLIEGVLYDLRMKYVMKKK